MASDETQAKTTTTSVPPSVSSATLEPLNLVAENTFARSSYKLVSNDRTIAPNRCIVAAIVDWTYTTTGSQPVADCAPMTSYPCLSASLLTESAIVYQQMIIMNRSFHRTQRQTYRITSA